MLTQWRRSQPGSHTTASQAAADVCSSSDPLRTHAASCPLIHQVEKNKLGLRIFQMMQSLENEDYLDFGEFMKALGTFCMLGCVLLSAELGVGW